MKHVWYVAYGSNLSRERFRRYIRGGRPDGSERDLPGCRDTSDPMDSFGVLIRGGVYFAGHSSGWRAGMAFYDPGAHGEVAGRAYLITAEQFVDVLAQEARQAPGITLDLTPTFRGDRFSKGVGGYSILVRVGERGGVPLVTFTRDRRTAPSSAAPSTAYLAAMATGLREAHGWSPTQIDRYLSALPGTAPALREAVEHGLLAINPADQARPPAARAARAPEIHPWTGPQLGVFLGWAFEQACQDAAAWHVLAYTGARRGEVLALLWRDLDTDMGRLAVRRSVGLVRVKGEGARLVEGPTNSGRERVVDLDPGTVDVLRRHRVARAGQASQLARDDALIFADLDGRHLHPERFSRRFSEQLDRCRRSVEGLPAIRLHDLRHTHARHLRARDAGHAG